MVPWKHQRSLGLMPWERFVTSYSSDYKPFSEHHPQVNQMKPRTEAVAAPAFIDPSQSDYKTWSIFHQYFYKTTNSIYGSSGCAQPPSCSLSPAALSQFGTLAPSISEASRVVGTALTEARTQEVGDARQSWSLLGEEEKGQMRYVFGGKANVLEQQEAKDEPQQKIDVLYEEGVIVLSSHVCPACCEDLLRSVCREAGQEHLLHLPVASSPIKDAESWKNSAYLKDLRPANALTDSTCRQPTCRHCSCAWEIECSNSCCFKMQAFPPGIPHGSKQSLAHVQPTVNHTEPSREPWLADYQASYNVAWAQPKIQ